MSDEEFKSILNSILKSEPDNTDDNHFEECTICLDTKLIKKTYCGCSTRYCHSCYETVMNTSGITCTVCKNILTKQIVQIPDDYNNYNDYNEGIYSYGFALNPESYQPSGTLNYSRIDSVQIYATSYNILRIMSGDGILRYLN